MLLKHTRKKELLETGPLFSQLLAPAFPVPVEHRQIHLFLTFLALASKTGHFILDLGTCLNTFLCQMKLRMHNPYKVDLEGPAWVTGFSGPGFLADSGTKLSHPWPH